MTTHMDAGLLAPRRPLSVGRAILFGTLVVGVLDIADALAFYGTEGATPTRIFQGIAGGLLGRASFHDGLATVALGVALHFFIAFAVVAVYVAASRRLAVLARRPFLLGTLYGLAVYAVMYGVVLPASRAGHPHFTMPNVVDELLAHTLLVGIPAALFARAAAPAVRAGGDG